MLIIGLLASVAATTPVYLDCTVPRAGAAPFKVEVALDEANQRATIALDTGRVVVRPAVFSPDQVKVPDEEATWTISRVDLRIHRALSFMPAGSPGETGSCTIKPEPAKRAF